MSTPYTAKELLIQEFGIERCRECNVVVAKDWSFEPYSNKQVIICPQCGDKYYIERLKELQNENIA